MGSGGFSVHRQDLINQAGFWDAQAVSMGGYARQATGAMWHGEAGIFASVVTPYNQVCQEVSQWCDQGQAQQVPYTAQYGLSVSGIASTPVDTAVGGTDLNWGNTPSPYWNSSRHFGGRIRIHLPWPGQVAQLSNLVTTLWPNVILSPPSLPIQMTAKAHSCLTPFDSWQEWIRTG